MTDEVEMHLGVFLEPGLILFVCVEIVQNDVEVAIGKSRHNTVHELEEFDATTPF